MAKFLAQAQGNRGATHRLGGAESGIKTIAASWDGAISVRMHEDSISHAVMVVIHCEPWHGRGETILVYSGTLADLQSGAVHMVQQVKNRKAS